MMLKSNVPETPMFVSDDYHTFMLGDRVRVQFYPEKEKKYPYSGSGMIGKIAAIYHDSFLIKNNMMHRIVRFTEVFIIKKVDDKENFDNTPYINDEEREFWRTHWITKDGIKKKTAEDSKMLEEFNKEWKK